MFDRRDVMLGLITKDMRGVEIGPWNAPLVPKAAGFNSLSMDVFATEKLRDIAQSNPFMNQADKDRIEDVDLVGAAHELAEKLAERGEAGSLDYVVSSHNFEHLPIRSDFFRPAPRP